MYPQNSDPPVAQMPSRLAAFWYVAENLGSRVNEPTQEWQIYNRHTGAVVVSVSLVAFDGGITKKVIWANVLRETESKIDAFRRLTA